MFIFMCSSNNRRARDDASVMKFTIAQFMNKFISLLFNGRNVHTYQDWISERYMYIVYEAAMQQNMKLLRGLFRVWIAAVIAAGSCAAVSAKCL